MCSVVLITVTYNVCKHSIDQLHTLQELVLQDELSAWNPLRCIYTPCILDVENHLKMVINVDVQNMLR